MISLSVVIPCPVLAQAAGDKTPKALADSPVPEQVPAQVSAAGRNDTPSYQLRAGEDPENWLFLPFMKHLVRDQKTFWTSPFRTQAKDLPVLLPFVAFTGSLIASDSWLSRQVPDKPNQLKRSRDISNYAVFSLIGVAGGSFALGHIKSNDHLAETGLLSAEAAINSTAVTYAFKAAMQRPRPYQDNGNGTFFQGGSSFPSEHAAIAWSAASVFAHEYPGPVSKFLAYGLASTVTLTRATGKQHFPSDVIVGSALGWFLGRQIYRAHHDPEVGGGAWGDLTESGEAGPRNPENMGSPYVPIDSWVYDAFDRLIALGYIQTAHADLRPWTRMECARLLEEASDRLRDGAAGDNEMVKLYDALSGEFAEESLRRGGAANVGAGLDSVYTRVTTISGTPLRDGYHFAQTLTNDYGRPYWEGTNVISGVAAHAVAGPLFINITGEYQHAPAIPAYAAPVLQNEAAADGVTFLNNGHAQFDRFELLDSAVGFTFHNLQISFGKQSLWLGPGKSGPLLFSNNAAPLPMLRIDNVSPYRIPLLSKLLGPARAQFFLGRLEGQNWAFAAPTLYGPDLPSQPWVHGTKFSFKPTENLEFGMGFTAQFGGTGSPFTWSNFLRTFYSHKATLQANPGKRLSAFDFSYRIPGLRNWLTLYADSMVIDEYSPLGSSRPSMNPGLYLSHFPRLPKLDLRVEGVSTDLFTMPDHFGKGATYFDSHFRSGYTNDGMLLGSWIGRMGRGEQAWATYWLSPRNTIQIGYRHQDVDRDFLQGGRLNDFNARADIMLRNDLSLSSFVQYESWRFRELASEPQTNFTVSLQLTWFPRWTRSRMDGSLKGVQ